MRIQEFSIIEQTLEPAVTLIEASAGTGKTYNIQHLYLRFVLEKGFTPESILVVTFSREATAELKQRIGANLAAAENILLDCYQEDGSRELSDGVDKTLVLLLDKALKINDYSEVLRRVQFAVRAMDEAAIQTIHGFCLSLLGDYAFESGALFGVELAEDRSRLFAELLADYVESQIASRSDMEGALFREYLNLGVLEKIPEIVFARDDIDIIGSAQLPDISRLYRELQFEDFAALRKALKSKRGTKSYIILDFIEQHPESSSDEMLQFILLINSKDVDSITKAKYFQTVFPQEFQDVIMKFRMIPDIIAFQGYKGFIDYLEYYCSELLPAQEEAKLLFDDLLYLTKKAVVANKRGLVAKVRGMYPVALVDEFQDTSGVQYEVFNTLFGDNKAAFFMIGDPKQSIYAFRGADINSYLAAVNAPGVSRATLTRNFRSTPDFIAAMNTFFASRKDSDGVPLPFVLQGIDYIEVTAGGKPGWRLCGDDSVEPLEIRWNNSEDVIGVNDAEREIIRSVAADIAGKLTAAQNGSLYLEDNDEQRQLLPSDFAVLVDKNIQGEWIRSELNRLGVVGVLLKSDSVFSSIEAEELSIVLQAIQGQNREAELMSVLTTRCFVYSLSELAEYRLEENRLLDYWLSFFTELSEILENSGFLQAITVFFEREHEEVGHDSVKSVLAALSGGERILTNYLQLVEILEHELLLHNYQGREVVTILEAMRLDISGSEEHEMRLESDENAVKIMTVHKSKGLQFPIVYLPFMFAGRHDNKKFSAPLTCHLENGKTGLILLQAALDEKHKQLELEARAERMRLLYVGVTRAVVKCIIYGGSIKGVETSALADIFAADFSRMSLLQRDSNIAVVAGWDYNEQYYTPQSGCAEFNSKRFDGNIERDWGVMSYSSLVSHDFISHDVRSDISWVSGMGEEGVEVVDNLQPLPSSNVVGSAVHEILEETCFSQVADGVDNDFISGKLTKFGIAQDNGRGSTGASAVAAVSGMLEIVSALELTPDSGVCFTLADIQREALVSEMAFYFPVRKRIDTGRMYEFFREKGLKRFQSRDEFSEVLSGLGLILQQKGFREGYLYGLIDLVFEYQGRYYFADWKTNNLARYGGYTPPAVLASMGDSGYLLQFYIYTVALNLYLCSRIKDFDYTRHFGGGYYLYLRGLELKNPAHGVFYDLPSEDDVKELIEIFSGRKP